MARAFLVNSQHSSTVIMGAVRALILFLNCFLSRAAANCVSAPPKCITRVGVISASELLTRPGANATAPWHNIGNNNNNNNNNSNSNNNNKSGADEKTATGRPWSEQCSRLARVLARPAKSRAHCERPAAVRLRDAAARERVGGGHLRESPKSIASTRPLIPLGAVRVCPHLHFCRRRGAVSWKSRASGRAGAGFVLGRHSERVCVWLRPQNEMFWLIASCQL